MNGLKKRQNNELTNRFVLDLLHGLTILSRLCLNLIFVMLTAQETFTEKISYL